MAPSENAEKPGVSVGNEGLGAAGLSEGDQIERKVTEVENLLVPDPSEIQTPAPVPEVPSPVEGIASEEITSIKVDIDPASDGFVQPDKFTARPVPQKPKKFGGSVLKSSSNKQSEPTPPRGVIVGTPATGDPAAQVESKPDKSKAKAVSRTEPNGNPDKDERRVRHNRGNHTPRRARDIHVGYDDDLDLVVPQRPKLPYQDRPRQRPSILDRDEDDDEEDQEPVERNILSVFPKTPNLPPIPAMPEGYEHGPATAPHTVEVSQVSQQASVPIESAELPPKTAFDSPLGRIKQEFEARYQKDQDHETALSENALYDRAFAEDMKLDIEGKIRARKDEGLRGFVRLSDEILELSNRVAKTPEEQDEINAALADKRQLFKDSTESYEKKDVDKSGLNYIIDRVEHPDREQLKGSIYFNGLKVEIVDLIESPELGSNKSVAYTIRREDGKLRDVQEGELEFKKDYANGETPAAEEKRSFVERAKEWLKKPLKKIQESAGMDWMGRKAIIAQDWLSNIGLKENMTEAEIARQQKIRLYSTLGAGAILIAAAAGNSFGGNLFETVGATDLSTALSGANWDPSAAGDYLNQTDVVGNQPLGAQLKEILDGAEWQQPPAGDYISATQPNVGGATDTTFLQFEDGTTPGSEATPISSEALNNEAYNIPDGGEGYKVFNELRLSSEVWDAHAAELVRLFPTEFYFENGDVRLMDPGWLSVEARTYIEKLRG